MATGPVSPGFSLDFLFVLYSPAAFVIAGLTLLYLHPPQLFRPKQLCLNQHRGDRLRCRALGHQETAIPVKLDRRGLDDVRVLPQTCVALVQSDCRRVVRRHGS